MPTVLAIALARLRPTPLIVVRVLWQQCISCNENLDLDLEMYLLALDLEFVRYTHHPWYELRRIPGILR